MTPPIRKIVSITEEIFEEAGQKVSPPARRVASLAVIANPFAGRYMPDLTILIEAGAELGEMLAQRALAALGVTGAQVQSYGKAAIVGEEGELEHAAALLHPSFGAPMRQAIGGGKALIPSAKKRAGAGAPIDIPLGHKDAAFVRSHFDAMEVRIADAPHADEILIAAALTDSGRPLPRVGGLQAEAIVGTDGLR